MTHINDSYQLLILPELRRKDLISEEDVHSRLHQLLVMGQS